MDPEIFMRDRQIFREKLLEWARVLTTEPVPETAHIEISTGLEDMVRDIEILGTPPPLRSLNAEDFDLVETASISISMSTLGLQTENGEDEDLPEGFELIDPCAEADFGRLCSKDGTVRDTLSWAVELLRRRHAPVSDIAMILDMLALHIGRLRWMPVMAEGKGIMVDSHADEMDEMARRGYDSRQNLTNVYLQAVRNRLDSCMECNCDKCGLVRQ